MSNNVISFMGANYIAQQVNWNMTGGWGEGLEALRAYYQPEETFAERFDALIGKVKSLGFDAFDLYEPQLGAPWASQQQVEAAKEILHRHGVTVPSIIGGYGENLLEAERCCQFAQEFGATLFSGMSPLVHQEPDGFRKLLAEYGIVFAWENHPENSAAEHFEKVRDLDPEYFGLAIDTGWYSTQGVDAAAAIRENAERIRHVHLKDVLPKTKEETPYQLKNMGHETCALGDGVTNIPAVIRVLKEIDYRGPLCIEHEPEEYDPSDECRVSLQRLKEWMA